MGDGASFEGADDEEDASSFAGDDDDVANEASFAVDDEPDDAESAGMMPLSISLYLSKSSFSSSERFSLISLKSVA